MLANTHLLFSIPALLCSLKFLLQRHKEDEEHRDLEEFGKGPTPIARCVRGIALLYVSTMGWVLGAGGWTAGSCPRHCQ